MNRKEITTKEDLYKVIELLEKTGKTNQSTFFNPKSEKYVIYLEHIFPICQITITINKSTTKSNYLIL